MSNETAIYSTTKDFYATTQKSMRSNVRRMLKRRDVNEIHFSFADNDTDKAKRFEIKITVNRDVKRVDFDNNQSYAQAKIIKILAKSDDDSKFSKIDNDRALYAKIRKFYQLVQR